MNQLFKSLSKTIALIVVAAASLGFLSVVAANLKAEQVVIAVVGMFSSLVTGVSTYYFMKNKYESSKETLDTNKAE